MQWCSLNLRCTSIYHEHISSLLSTMIKVAWYVFKFQYTWDIIKMIEFFTYGISLKYKSTLMIYIKKFTNFFTVESCY